MTCDLHPKTRATHYVQRTKNGMLYVFNVCKPCAQRIKTESPTVRVRMLGVQSRSND